MNTLIFWQCMFQKGDFNWLLEETRKSEGLMEHKKENCDCIFCSARCHGCGGVNVHVEFSAKYSLTNTEKDSLSLSYNGCAAKVYCPD